MSSIYGSTDNVFLFFSETSIKRIRGRPLADNYFAIYSLAGSYRPVESIRDSIR